MTKTFFDDVVFYIKNNLKKGYTKDSLRVALLNQGYSRYEIERAIKKVDSDLASEAPILKTKPKITYEIFPMEENENTQKAKIKTEKERHSFWRNLFGF